MERCRIAGCERPVKWKAESLCNAHGLRLRRHGDPEGGGPSLGAATVFYEAALAYKEDDCLIWPFAYTGPKGRQRPYLANKSETRTTIVSRRICEDVYGPPPTPKHQAAHSCGNGVGGCVNPRHLRWATASENEGDKVLHGTSNRGERQGSSKLTEDAVRALRIAVEAGETQRSVATRFGVSLTTVNLVFHRKHWAWLE